MTFNCLERQKRECRDYPRRGLWIKPLQELLGFEDQQLSFHCNLCQARTAHVHLQHVRQRHLQAHAERTFAYGRLDHVTPNSELLGHAPRVSGTPG